MRRRFVPVLLLSLMSVSGCGSDDGGGFQQAPSADAGDSALSCDCPLGGCCVGASCVSPEHQDWHACGANSQVCEVCAPGALCTSLSGCDNESWGPHTLLRLRLGTLRVNAACDPDSDCDPYVCFRIRGKDICTGACKNSNVCDYGSTTPPFVIEKFVPSDFTSGDLTIYVMDEDIASDDVIWSGKIQELSPLHRKMTPYELGSPGGPMTLSFTLESMQ